jgi:hypothetical protein
MKKLLNRIRTRINRTAAWILISTPWYSAYVIAAAKVYRESDRWRERVSVLGMDYADRAFYTSPFEIKWFKREARKDKKLMLRVIFAPYSVRV